MGFVSRRHLEAIKAVGGNLIAYHDVMDVVGHVDAYFIDALYYPEFINFNCFIDRYSQSDKKIDYAIILLPNHLHNPACRWAMTMGMNVICEKPLVLYEKNLDELLEVEQRTGKKINTILQMRLHPETERMESLFNSIQQKPYINIIYKTERGHWFRHDGGWKSDPKRSGGLCTSIGVHIFDLLANQFGRYIRHKLEYVSDDTVQGWLHLEDSEKITFDLSVEPGGEIERTFKIGTERFNFTDGFNDLHIKSYKNILEGKGFGIEDARMGIRICEQLRKNSSFNIERNIISLGPK